jgi:hypothetical protein
MCITYDPNAKSPCGCKTEEPVESPPGFYDKSDAPDPVPTDCTGLVSVIWDGRSHPISEERESKFVRDLECLINCACLENESDTPDFILAEYMRDSMKAFNKACNRRRDWYGFPQNPDANRK